MAAKGPWLLAVGLDLLASGIDDDIAVSKLLNLAGGRRELLRGAYARALSLAAELPDDLQAQRLVQLLIRAMRGDRRQKLAPAPT